MPKTIGLTGGIGSGKSRVARLFSSLGVPCYIADQRAKALMGSDESLKRAIVDCFGPQAYKGKELNRHYLAEIVFQNPKQLAKLNALVHPVVAVDYQDWLSEQDTPYVIKEVAILFETGGHQSVDKSILITAPKDIRIARVMQRDNCTKEAVVARMANQWDDDRRIPLADIVIENIDWAETEKQIRSIHHTFFQA